LLPIQHDGDRLARGGPAQRGQGARGEDDARTPWYLAPVSQKHPADEAGGEGGTSHDLPPRQRGGRSDLSLLGHEAVDLARTRLRHRFQQGLKRKGLAELEEKGRGDEGQGG